MIDANRVLGLLYDRGDGCVEPRELAAAAGLDRSALAAALDVLVGRGHRLTHTPAGAVGLARPLRLDGHLIGRDLPVQRVAADVICFDEVDSTNDVAFDSARRDDADGLVVFAESQRSGRGRFGRAWLSRPMVNLLFSVLLLDTSDELPPDALTIAAGVAIAEGLADAGAAGAQLKWPNDVVLSGKKAAGVLVERRRVAAAGAVVIGVGINVNAAPSGDLVDRPATCVADQLGHPVERTEVARSVLVSLDRWLGRITEGKLGELHSAWLARCDMLGQRVTVGCGDRQHTGRVLDVDPLTGLVLGCDDGHRLHLPAAGSTLLS